MARSRHGGVLPTIWAVGIRPPRRFAAPLRRGELAPRCYSVVKGNLVCYPAGSNPFAPNTATKNPPFGGFYKTLVRAKYFAALTHGSPRNPAGSSPFAPNTATKNPPFGGFYKTLVRAKGLEPSTSTLARLRSSQLSYARTVWDILTYLFYLCKQFFI